MSGNDHTDSARAVNPARPFYPLRPGEFWPRWMALDYLSCDEKTFRMWVKTKLLRVYRPRTKEQFIKTDDLISLIEQFPVEPEVG